MKNFPTGYFLLMVTLVITIISLSRNEEKNMKAERDSARARFTVLAEGLRAASNFTPKTGVELPAANDSTFRILFLKECPGFMLDRTYLEVTVVLSENGWFTGYYWTASGYRQIVVRKDDVERYF